jgi:hypothetical protein
MKRLAQSRQKKTQLPTTILGTLPIDLAPKERGRLFEGLQAVANTGDSEQEYTTVAKRWPSFWPRGSEELAWSSQLHTNFLFYRDNLRLLWRGSFSSKYQQLGAIAYLLGLTTSEEADTFLQGPDALLERLIRSTNKPSSSGSVSSSQSIILPLWGSMEFQFVSRGDFEAALWVLFRESWRARICGQCKHYFIADRPAQIYCSTRCNGEAKKEQRLAWWNKSGAIRRKAARAKTIKRKKK